MKKSVVFLFLVCCAFSALSLAENKNDPKSPATVSPPKPFTSTTPKPTTKTTKPTTTTAKPTTTTTTAKPTTTTTTAKPTTTTTTAKPTTTTTTAKPTTTKTTSAPPAPEPTPSTNLTVGYYNLTDKDGICLRAQMAVQIRVVTKELNGTFIVQPDATTVKGTCGDKEANLTLSFKEGFITFLFNKSTSDNTGYVYSLSFKVDYAFVTGQMKTYEATNGTVHLFSAKVGHSYSCKGESLFMGKGLYLDVTQDRMQAFGLSKSKEFGTPDHCSADQPDYRVAIGVGIALLVLIIVVVVAYLITRKRRSGGYQPL